MPLIRSKLVLRTAASANHKRWTSNRTTFAMRLAPALFAALLVGCSGASDPGSCIDRPVGSSINVASIDEAFSIILKSDDRDERYSATLYVKAHVENESLEHYRNRLTNETRLSDRIRIFESMGFYGGSTTAYWLGEFLRGEAEVETKAQLICALGHIGGDAAETVALIDTIKAEYGELYAMRESQGGRIDEGSDNARWLVHDKSMPPIQFNLITDESMNRIHADDYQIVTPETLELVIEDFYYEGIIAEDGTKPAGGDVGQLRCGAKPIPLASSIFDNGHIVTEGFGKIRVRFSSSLTTTGFAVLLRPSQLSLLKEYCSVETSEAEK